jgi:hypothetical protein
MRRKETAFPKLNTADPAALETDLREISRESDICSTVVRLSLDWNRDDARPPVIDWLKFGQANLRRQIDSSHDGRYRLEAYLKEGVTDFEHDSAYALRLPLVGVQLSTLPVLYHNTILVGWVDSAQDEDYEDFHVPRPGYNPMKHPEAHICKSEYCKRDEEHIIVPEGFYVPPFDQELFDFVKGKRVEIIMGPVRK